MKRKRLVFDDAAGAHHSARSIDTNGYMHVDNCPLTKEQVAPYLGREVPGWQSLGLESERIYHVYRPASELSRPETVDSVKSIPFLLDHAEVSPDNIRENQIIGNVGDNAKWDGKYLRCNVTVYAQKAQDRIQDKSMRELSLSYAYTPELKQGSFKGKPYDIVMHDIRANHLALVEAGRAGSDVRVSDSMPMELTQMENSNEIIGLLNRILDAVSASKPGAVDSDVPEDEDQQLAPEAENEAQDNDMDDPAQDDEDEVATDDDEEVTEDDDEEVTDDDDDEIAEDDDDEVTDDDDDEIADDDDDEVTDDDDDEIAEDDDEEVTDDDDGGTDEALINLLKAAGIEPTEENLASIRKLSSSESGKATDSARSIRRAKARKASRRLAMDRRSVSKVVRQQLRKEGAAVALNKIKRMQLAADSCKPILGRVNIYKFKSSNEIWRRAAIKSGLSPKLAKDSRTARGYVKSELKHKASKPRRFVSSSTLSNRVDRDVMAFLNNIEV